MTLNCTGKPAGGPRNRVVTRTLACGSPPSLTKDSMRCLTRSRACAPAVLSTVTAKLVLGRSGAMGRNQRGAPEPM
jgi:hypothetical protein